jgi:precorrin-3B synthase
VGTVVPLGRLTAAQGAALADAVMRRAHSASAPHHNTGAPHHDTGATPDGEVLITPWRSVVLPDLAPADVDETAARLRSVGLVTDPGSPWVGVTACAGRPGCAKALADVRTDAANTATSAGGRVHWIGCERGCGRPTGPHVEVRATAGGYLVDGTPAHNLADMITAARRSL